MKQIFLKKGEVAVSQNDFGLLVDEFVRNELRPGRNIDDTWMNAHLRKWWPMIEEYYQRHIITAIEVAITLDDPPRYNRQELCNKDMWVKIVKDLRHPRSPFTIDYHCHKCKLVNVKLWRGAHNCGDDEGHDLLCASCLVPDLKVSKEGTAIDKSFGGETDQINGWLPAIPVDDTFWGYSGSPSQDVEWWTNLPTYPKK